MVLFTHHALAESFLKKSGNKKPIILPIKSDNVVANVEYARLCLCPVSAFRFALKTSNTFGTTGTSLSSDVP